MVNPKCIEKEAPVAKVESKLERENGKVRQIGMLNLV